MLQVVRTSFFWTRAYDFLLVFCCNLASIAHRFVNIEVLLLAGNDVISKCPPGVWQVAGTSIIWKRAYNFLWVFYCNFACIMHSFVLYRGFTVDRKWRHIKMSTGGRFRWIIQAPTRKWTAVRWFILRFYRWSEMTSYQNHLPDGAAGYFDCRFGKNVPSFIIKLCSRFLFIFHRLKVFRLFRFGWDFHAVGENLVVLGENDFKEVKILKNTCLECKNTCLECTSSAQTVSFELLCIRIG